MDNFESNVIGNEAQAAMPKKRSPYADSPYAVSPYANSPHVVNQPVADLKNIPQQRSSGNNLKRVISVLLVLLLVVASCSVTALVVDSRWESRMTAMGNNFNNRFNALQDQMKDLENGTDDSGSGIPIVPVEGAMTPGQVYAANVKSVVMVNNTGTGFVSTGTGFVISADGYIVTNHHVVDGAVRLTVTMSDGKVHKAELVGGDSVNDIAVLKVEATDLSPVKMGSSDKMVVGDQVVAIGNPLGELTSTLTVGYISAKERDVTTDGTAINMLQTDAAINSGNSGGPLFNMKGEVIGVTTAKYSGTSSSGATIEGIGFAIPIDDVYDIITDLQTLGYITGAYLGVSVSDTNNSAAEYFGMPVGAYVQEVVKGYCAHKAGVQAKDIIVDVGGYKVENVSDLTRALRKFDGGEQTTITVYRSGREIMLPITLDEKPQN